METKDCLTPVDAVEFFKTIRRDELEILEQLIPLEIYTLGEYGDLLFNEDGRPIVEDYNPESKIDLVPTNRFYVEVKGKNGTLTDSIVNSYRDVFSLDDSLLDSDATLYVYSDSKTGYNGCVWIFEDENYLGVYGIRSSIANTINGKRGVATAMMKCIIASTEKPVVVPWPLEGMLPVLRRLGFKEYNTEEENPVRKFLEPYTTTSNYWILQR